MVPFHALFQGGLQQVVGAQHIGPDEFVRLHDTAVDMRLRREVHDAIRPGFLKDLGHLAGMADVAHHQVKPIREAVCHILQVFAAAGIGQLVEDHNPGVGEAREQEANVVAAYEAGTTGHKITGHGITGKQSQNSWRDRVGVVSHCTASVKVVSVSQAGQRAGSRPGSAGDCHTGRQANSSCSP